jgi:hypothetical protein
MQLLDSNIARQFACRTDFTLFDGLWLRDEIFPGPLTHTTLLNVPLPKPLLPTDRSALAVQPVERRSCMISSRRIHQRCLLIWVLHSKAAQPV